MAPWSINLATVRNTGDAFNGLGFFNARDSLNAWAVPLARVDLLELANWGMLILGWCLVVAFFARRLARRGDSLWGFPPVRAFRLSPEALFVPVLAFLLTAVMLPPVVGIWIDPPAAAAGDSQSSADTEVGIQTRSVSIHQAVVGSLSVLAGGIACYLVGRRQVGTRDHGFVLGDRRIARQLFDGAWVALAAMAACQTVLFLTVSLIERFSPAYEFGEHSVIEALRDPSSPGWFLAIIWIGTVVVTPVAEEMFFRGLVQTALVRVLNGRALAIMLTGAVFALAHSSQPQVLPAIAMFGMMLGVLYERTGSLLAPIIAHAIFNGRTLLWDTFGTLGA